MPFLFLVILAVTIWWIDAFGIDSTAISAFIGVIVGGLITGGFQYWVSERNQVHQLRMAALEKRLAVHQQAYSLWIKLLFADKTTTEIGDVVMKCQDWWEKNCLYLSPKARKAFRRAYHSASDHAKLIRQHADSKLIKEASQDVEAAGRAILDGVNLPPISGEDERVSQ